MNTNQVARIAALAGEPARTAMLLALLDGRALTAGELAAAARIGAATASRHLQLLTEGGLLRQERQGRHRYHRLASPEVARWLEGLLQVAAGTPPPAPVATGPRDASLRLARTCYDHLAGALAVALAEHLVEEGAVVLEDDTARVTPRLAPSLQQLGVAPGLWQPAGPRPACRPCLDWGERRMHLAGRLGALLCTHCLEAGWLRRQHQGRALDFTPAGARALRDVLGLARWEALAAPALPGGR